MTRTNSVHVAACAVVNLVFGLWFLVPLDSDSGTFVLRPTSAAALGYFWGMTLFGLGIVMLGYAHRGREQGVSFSAGLGFVIWLTVTGGIVFFRAQSVMVPLSVLMAAWCLAVYRRYREEV